MANYNSSYAAGLLASRTDAHSRQSLDAIQQSVRNARFAVTLTGAEAAGDTLTLGPLNIPRARVIPEQCRVRHGAGGAGVSLPATLRKVDRNLANAVDLTTKVTLVSTAVQTYASTNALELPELAADDTLQLLLADTVTPVAGRVLVVEVAYRTQGR